ncbi:hypothetical protein L2E82_35602 [Cichorium intybus]|uniref:Uncharacterized protein n=1 Tax=Cichorium intybus TaxID=13427 RepID=A0ACB9BP84_CICIN|nr:hypothetical protein L2E82_35602 [Cichorium intybus]
MMQKCKLMLGDEGDNTDLTHDMKAIQKQVTEDQQLLRERPVKKDVGPSRASNGSGEMVSMENKLIVNEFFHGQQYSNATDEDQTMVKVRQTMEKAFWNGITDSIHEDDYDRVVELMKEVRDELCEMAPQSWKQEITETIDVVILSRLLNSGSLDMEYLGKIMDFALISLQKLSAPANENNFKEAYQKVLQELADICQKDDSNHSQHLYLQSQHLYLQELFCIICELLTFKSKSSQRNNSCGPR